MTELASRNGHDEIRTIDVGAPPARFARGWHCLGLAESFRDGKPHAIAGVRHETGGVRGLDRQAERAGRVLPAHGR